MKFTKILTTAAVALGATLALSGCIRETFPKESAITTEQLQQGQMDVVAENLLKGIPSGMMSYISGWEHTDFGYHSVGVYNDHACALIVMCGHQLGNPAGYSRFYPASYGWGYAHNSALPQHVWYNYYPQIKSCNNMIKLVGDNEQLQHYVGIAKTFRAMFYLDLARMFECLYAEAPNNGSYENQQIKVAGLTVPIVDENINEETAKNNPRATREELFNFIFADLAAAEESLAEYQPSSIVNPDLAVVYGLYARAYMWLGGFDDGLNGELPSGNEAYALASEYANKALAAHGGAITTEAEWTSTTTGFNTPVASWMWGLTWSSDTIINNLFQFTAHLSPEAAYGYGPLSQPGVSAKAFERLQKTDFRRNLIKGPETTWEEFAPYTLMTSADEFNTFAPYTNFKFRPAQGERNDYMTAGAISLPLMRTEEMYFIDMEATLHTSGVDAAWQKLIAFMAYRDSNYVCPYATEDGILDEIIFQKSIEFWGEGIVMYDMKRLDMGIDTAFPGTNYPADARFQIEGRVPWWSYCIPMDETQINLAIKENNPNPSQSWDPILPME